MSSRFVRGFLCLGLLVFAFSMSPASAAPYIGLETFTYHQPDGSQFAVKLYGDEFFAYQETLDGRVVVKDEASGFYCYATLSQDGTSLVSTGIPVVTATQSKSEGSQKAAQAGVRANLRLPDDAVLASVRKAQQKYRVDEKGRPLMPEDASSAKSSALKSPPSTTTTGSYVGLCILVDFSDQAGTIPQADVDTYFNQASGYTGYSNACSVREYFSIQSAGLLDYTNVVTAYVRVSQPKTYYDDNSPNDWGSSKAQELVAEALDILMVQGFDFTQMTTSSGGYINCINLFYAGTVASGWSNGLWPHSWAIPAKLVDAANGIYAYRYQMTDMQTSLRIGTMCHENGHMLCKFPDLYAYNSSPAEIAYYSLMASGNYGDGKRHPVNVDPYLKAAAGWATVIDVLTADHLTATLDVTANTYYRFKNPSDPQEYFIFEARGNGGYEGPYGGSTASVNPTSGVVGYHVLETGSNTYSSITNSSSCDYTTPYELLLLEASPADNSPNPWYLDPSPNSTDAFHSGGVDELNAGTTPELMFWASDGRTVASPFNIYSVSAIATVMTFEAGLAADEIVAFIEPSEAIAAGAQWRIDGGAWRDSGVAATGLSTGTYTISFSEVMGFDTPDDEIVTLTGTQGEAVYATYTAQSVTLPVALNAEELSWSTSGGALWFGQRSISNDGHASGQSGDIDDNELTRVQTTVTGPGTMRFRWKVSSEATYDYLRLFIDNWPVQAITGEVDWTLAEQAISSGTHTVIWAYLKDESTSSGSDCGWVDEVCFVPTGSPSGSLLVTLSPASAVSAGAQWRVDGGEWQDSETTVNLLTAGSHTVSFNTLAGWDSPTDVEVTISDNTVTMETATYTATAPMGSLTVTIDPSSAVIAGAAWNVDGGGWRESGETASGLVTGDHTVAFKTLTGWQEPVSASVTVTENGRATHSGTYTSTALPGPGVAFVVGGLALAGWAALRRRGRR